MSRSKHQHHRVHRRYSEPNYYLEVEDEFGKKLVVKRHRKHKPYGSKRSCGYGGETYVRRLCEYVGDVVNKKWERRRAKKEIECSLHSELLIASGSF